MAPIWLVTVAATVPLKFTAGFVSETLQMEFGVRASVTTGITLLSGTSIVAVFRQPLD